MGCVCCSCGRPRLRFAGVRSGSPSCRCFASLFSCACVSAQVLFRTTLHRSHASSCGMQHTATGCKYPWSGYVDLVYETMLPLELGGRMRVQYRGIPRSTRRHRSNIQRNDAFLHRVCCLSCHPVSHSVSQPLAKRASHFKGRGPQQRGHYVLCSALVPKCSHSL